MSQGIYIKSNILRVKPDLLDPVIKFYTTLLGMNHEPETIPTQLKTMHDIYKTRHSFSYTQIDPLYPPTCVCFIVDPDFTLDYPNPGYWKIGITVQDVDAAVKYLQDRGVAVGPASQFCDIGYLTSLRDPQGYSIELLQTTFRDNFIRVKGERNAPLDQVKIPTLTQITIRCIDLEDTYNFYSEMLGMKLLCTEVPNNPKYKFSLHFFAYTSDTPPSDDPAAILNREWVYGRPYCQIEIQHRQVGAPDRYTTCSNHVTGHVGYSVCVSSEVWERVSQSVDQEADVVKDGGKKVAKIVDPDGYMIEVICEG